MLSYLLNMIIEEEEEECSRQGCSIVIIHNIVDVAITASSVYFTFLETFFCLF